MNQAFKRCYVFGEFRLDGAERQLLRAGTPVLLPPKILDTLLLLVENAGHLVAKDEFMKQLWPETFVGEDALARNISILRKTLGESSDSQSFIATVPTRGYRFVAPVQKVNGAALPAEENRPLQQPDFLPSAVTAEEPPGQPSQQSLLQQNATAGSVPANVPAPQKILPSHVWRRRIAFTALVLAAGSLAGFVTYYLLSPAPLPRVTRAVQLTHSGRADGWTRLVTDGSRIYFTERAGDHWNLVQTSVAGGESQIVAAPFPNTAVLDISPDHANLLIGTFDRRFVLMPLWIWPVQGGPPRRFGDIAAYDAIWSPNGREIIFSEDDGIHIANADGTNPRKLVPWESRPGTFSWSPDGGFLRFSASVPGTTRSTIWEVHSDGSSLRRLIPGSNDSPGEWNGIWEPRGRYFLFQSNRSGSHDIWALSERGSWLHRRTKEPIRLTSGPTEFSNPLVSPDGHRVFVYGADGKGDWMRFDLRSRQFLPVLPGVPLATLSFSRDGEWLAYVGPDYTLIRMRSDGTQRLAVGPSSFRPWTARWSPDSKQIVFVGTQPKGGLYIVSANGDAPRFLLPDGGDWSDSDPAWSPDGKDLVFDRQQKTSSSSTASVSLFVLHVSTNQVTPLPGSLGFWAPSWSPDGRYITAKSEDEHRLMLFDTHTQGWTQVAQANLLYGYPWWSSDQKCIYYQDLLAPNEPIYCLHWPSKKLEMVLSFEQLLQGNASRVAWQGLGPGDSFIVAVTRSESDIFALDVDFP